MTNRKSIAELTAEVQAIYKEYRATGTAPWTYDIAAKDLPYQVGSLMKRIMQLRGERHADNKSETALKNEIGDELADILAEVLFIASELEIDILSAWDRMLASDHTKIIERVAK